jgi:membrane protease subunit HflC
MKKSLKPFIIAIAVIFGLFIAGPFYVIKEGELAVIIQLGRLVRTVSDAGLYVKIPFIDEVVRYPKKIMTWDGEANIIPTSEGQFIWVDVTARWSISDTQKFYEASQNVDEANKKLGQIINSAVRAVVGENSLQESVRNSNLLLERMAAGETRTTVPVSPELGEDAIIGTTQTEEFQVDRPIPIVKGRRQLAEEILARSRLQAPNLGIELRDVVTRQIRYSDALTDSVHKRMIRERTQIAQLYRSQGERGKQDWLGQMEGNKRRILSAGREEAQTIMGKADAEAARIYAEAYNLDPNFFNFWRAVESYRTTMPKFNKTLSTDMEYFRYLYAPR